MGRGFFPLSAGSSEGKRLLEAANIIKQVGDEFSESIYSGSDGQFDNAASDGGSLALLNLAVKICRDEVTK